MDFEMIAGESSKRDVRAALRNFSRRHPGYSITTDDYGFYQLCKGDRVIPEVSKKIATLSKVGAFLVSDQMLCLGEAAHV